MWMDLIDAPRWYAVHTKPKQEDRADTNLTAWKVQTFNPKIMGHRRSLIPGKPDRVIKPLFPRYIFARFRASELLHKVRLTRGVQNIISFGGSPIPVDDEIIELIESRKDVTGLIRVGEKLSPGDRVVISGGHLNNFAGIFEGGMKDQDRITILLTTISYQGRVVIERELVKKVS